MSRTDNSIKNMRFGLLGQMLNLLLVFVTRRVFMDVLGEDYLGLHGLLSNVISMLSLAELGIGASIFFSLYKPIAENDKEKIKALMHLFKRAYAFVGLAVGVFGIAVLPFLSMIIERENPELLDVYADRGISTNIYLIFGLFVLNTVGSYFFVHKQSLLNADQKDYINTAVRAVSAIVLNVLQIIFLWVTRSYIAYLLIMVVVNFVVNLILSRKVDRLYPYLKERTRIKLSKEDVDELKKNVKSNTFHSLGSFLVFGTDNMLIATFGSFMLVARFSNYNIILSALMLIYGVVFTGMSASVGNLNASTEESAVEKNFQITNFLGFWLFGFSMTCLYILFNPFMTLWMGADRLLPQSIVILIIVNFYLKGMRRGVITYKDSLGLFWYDRFKPLIEAIINLAASIILGMHFGLAGILVGTIISTLSTSFWVEPYVLYKYGFKSKLRDYFKRYSVYTASAILVLLVTRFVVSFLTFEGVLGFILLTAVTVMVSNGLLALMYYRTPEFEALKRIFMAKVLRR